MRSIVTANGITTEVYRSDWGIVEGNVEQAIHVSLRGGTVSAWHQHRARCDFIMVVGGHMRVVLVRPARGLADPPAGRRLSPQSGPATLLAVLPWVWHGVQNISTDVSSFVNLFDRPYDYDDPDEWRLPPDTEDIPFSFG